MLPNRSSDAIFRDVLGTSSGKTFVLAIDNVTGMKARRNDMQHPPTAEISPIHSQCSVVRGDQTPVSQTR
jgi:hypothetical protein